MTAPSAYAILRGNAAFAAMEAASLQQLAASCTIRRYAGGESLFQTAERADGFFVIGSGEVEILRAAPNGREQILHILQSGEMCGEVPVFHGGRFPATARARGTVEAAYIPGDRFVDLATEHPESLLQMLAVICMRMRHFVGLIDDLSLKDVTARLAGHLLREAGDGESIRLDCTKSELAARLGTIPETLSRSLSRLKSQHLLGEQANGALRILDRTALDALATGKE